MGLLVVQQVLEGLAIERTNRAPQGLHRSASGVWSNPFCFDCHHFFSDYCHQRQLIIIVIRS